MISSRDSAELKEFLIENEADNLSEPHLAQGHQTSETERKLMQSCEVQQTSFGDTFWGFDKESQNEVF